MAYRNRSSRQNCRRSSDRAFLFGCCCLNFRPHVMILPRVGPLSLSASGQQTPLLHSLSFWRTRGRDLFFSPTGGVIDAKFFHALQLSPLILSSLFLHKHDSLPRYAADSLQPYHLPMSIDKKPCSPPNKKKKTLHKQ